MCEAGGEFREEVLGINGRPSVLCSVAVAAPQLQARTVLFTSQSREESSPKLPLLLFDEVPRCMARPSQDILAVY